MQMTARSISLPVAGQLLNKKKLLIMKLTAILLVTASLQTMASATAQTVTISLKNVSLEEVFKEIRKQTGYLFFYDVTLFEGAKPVTIQARDLTIEQVLNELLRDQPLDYSIENKTITIVKKNPSLKEQTSLPPPTTVRGRNTRRPRRAGVRRTATGAGASPGACRLRRCGRAATAGVRWPPRRPVRTHGQRAGAARRDRAARRRHR